MGKPELEAAVAAFETSVDTMIAKAAAKSAADLAEADASAAADTAGSELVKAQSDVHAAKDALVAAATAMETGTG